MSKAWLARPCPRFWGHDSEELVSGVFTSNTWLEKSLWWGAFPPGAHTVREDLDCCVDQKKRTPPDATSCYHFYHLCHPTCGAHTSTSSPNEATEQTRNPWKPSKEGHYCRAAYARLESSTLWRTCCVRIRSTPEGCITDRMPYGTLPFLYLRVYPISA